MSPLSSFLLPAPPTPSSTVSHAPATLVSTRVPSVLVLLAQLEPNGTDLNALPEEPVVLDLDSTKPHQPASLLLLHAVRTLDGMVLHASVLMELI